MEKRFGKNVKFADVESFAVNRTLEEMKENAKRREDKRYKSINEKHVKLKLSLFIRPLLMKA